MKNYVMVSVIMYLLYVRNITRHKLISWAMRVGHGLPHTSLVWGTSWLNPIFLHFVYPLGLGRYPLGLG